VPSSGAASHLDLLSGLPGDHDMTKADLMQRVCSAIDRRGLRSSSWGDDPPSPRARFKEFRRQLVAQTFERLGWPRAPGSR